MRSQLDYFDFLILVVVVLLFCQAQPQLNSTQLNFNSSWGWDSFISSFRQATHHIGSATNPPHRLRNQPTHP